MTRCAFCLGKASVGFRRKGSIANDVISVCNLGCFAMLVEGYNCTHPDTIDVRDYVKLPKKQYALYCAMEAL